MLCSQERKKVRAEANRWYAAQGLPTNTNKQYKQALKNRKARQRRKRKFQEFKSNKPKHERNGRMAAQWMAAHAEMDRAFTNN